MWLRLPSSLLCRFRASVKFCTSEKHLAQRNENCRACSPRRRDNKISHRRMYATVLWTKLLNTSGPLVYDAGHARCLKAARLITNWRDGGNKNESRASSPLICRIFSGKKRAHVSSEYTHVFASERASERTSLRFACALYTNGGACTPGEALMTVTMWDDRSWKLGNLFNYVHGARERTYSVELIIKFTFHDDVNFSSYWCNNKFTKGCYETFISHFTRHITSGVNSDNNLFAVFFFVFSFCHSM